MAVTATPCFSQSALLGLVQVATANSNRDGSTGTYSSSVAAGSNGSLVDYILFRGTVTSTAGSIRIFYSADNSTNWRLVGEVSTAAVTPSGTVLSDVVIWTPPGGVPFNLPASSGIKFCTANSETYNCFIHGSNL